MLFLLTTLIYAAFHASCDSILVLSSVGFCWKHDAVKHARWEQRENCSIPPDCPCRAAPRAPPRHRWFGWVKLCPGSYILGIIPLWKVLCRPKQSCKTGKHKHLFAYKPFCRACFLLIFLCCMSRNISVTSSECPASSVESVNLIEAIKKILIWPLNIINLSPWFMNILWKQQGT